MRDTFRPVRPRLTYSISPSGRIRGDDRTRKERFVSACSASTACSALFHVEQLDVEDERRVRWNHTAGAARAVAERRRDHERPLAADLHAGEPLIPALNHLSAAQTELKRI